MDAISRRSFLQTSARLTALMGLGVGAIGRIHEALAELASGQASVLWLQGQSCSGCSVSLLDSASLEPFQLLTRYINLSFHQTLSTATGHMAVDTANKIIEQGGYLLVVEGSVPERMPRACMFGGEPFGDQLLRAAKAAKAVVAAGTCAAFGGIPAAEHNATGAAPIPQFLENHGVKVPTILVPGCPTHPDWLVGTLAHLLKFGLPPLDRLGRPLAFFGRLIHDQCPRFSDYERERFAKHFGDEGCLFKLGCLGPLTRADCMVRHWNGGINACIQAGAPCIGCASPQFAARTDFPFYTTERAKLSES